MTKSEQEFRQFTKDFRKSMSAVIERLDALVALVAEDPAAPTPVPDAPSDTPIVASGAQDPLPFATGGTITTTNPSGDFRLIHGNDAK